MHKRAAFVAVSLSLVCLLAGTAGCVLIRAKKDLAQLGQCVRISGTVACSRPTTKPLCVALYEEVAGQARKQLRAYQAIYQNGTFSFLIMPGTYYLFAFEDINEDCVFQQNEPVGWYGSPSPLDFVGSTDLEKLTITLRPPAEARKELPLLYSEKGRAVDMQVANRHVGTVISLSDPRFDPETGVLGMWEPVTFFERYGFGLFFLQPYDPQRQPVLFVHGVGGTPRNFEYLAKSLDPARFQPWVLHYPSGLRLGLMAEALARIVDEVRTRTKCQSLIIVAHSMGGLVARDLLNRLSAQGKLSLPLFVSISSPWQGHPGAGVGVQHSPVILPCWYDMSPGSPYLEALRQTALPDKTAYYLLFGYRGDSAMMADGNTDGTLPLSSMLDPGMQNAAAKVLGFNETHASILSSPDVSARLNRILDSLAQ